MAKLEPLKIIVRGKHDMGKTTVAHLIKEFLEENDFQHVELRDAPPLPQNEKDHFTKRFLRNRKRSVIVSVELET